MSESIAHSWYNGDWHEHPWEEETVPKYTGIRRDNEKYSWIKAPRFDGKPMQVGPLAQVLAGFAQGHEPTERWASEDAGDGGQGGGHDS